MGISYQDIRTERQWNASTGMTSKQFKKLVNLFKLSYEDLFEPLEKEAEKKENLSGKLESYSSLLFFGLYSVKSGLSYDLLGLSFDLSSSVVYEKQSLFLRVLEVTLSRAGLVPKRGFANEEELKLYLANQSTVLIDATEQRVQRAVNHIEQKKDYSGKKKHIR